MQTSLLPMYVEIETSTYCNRSCSWCPNVRYERNDSQKLISPSLFTKIIGDLKEVGYSNRIALHNYNEPLFDPRLFEHITQIRSTLPSSELLILTNGDILNEQKCKELEASGVALLRITLYDAISSDNPRGTLTKHIKRCNLEDCLDDISDEFGTKLRTQLGGMSIIYYIPELTRFTSRGGIVQDIGSTTNDVPLCGLPFSSCAIDYEGNLKICCEIYPESEVHRRSGIIGNLNEHPFLGLWFSDEYNQLRRDMILGNLNNEVCNVCKSKPKNAEVDKELITLWKDYLGI